MKIHQGIDSLNTEAIKKDILKNNNKTENSNRLESDDKVELSPEVKKMKELETKAAEAPDVRSGKVEGIKLLLDDGNYRISNEQIAEKLIEESLIR